MSHEISLPHAPGQPCRGLESWDVSPGLLCSGLCPQLFSPYAQSGSQTKLVTHLWSPSDWLVKVPLNCGALSRRQSRFGEESLSTPGVIKPWLKSSSWYQIITLPWANPFSSFWISVTILSNGVESRATASFFYYLFSPWIPNCKEFCLYYGLPLLKFTSLPPRPWPFFC